MNWCNLYSEISHAKCLLWKLCSYRSHHANFGQHPTVFPWLSRSVSHSSHGWGKFHFHFPYHIFPISLCRLQNSFIINISTNLSVTFEKFSISRSIEVIWSPSFWYLCIFSVPILNDVLRRFLKNGLMFVVFTNWVCLKMLVVMSVLKKSSMIPWSVTPIVKNSTDWQHHYCFMYERKWNF